MKFRCFIFLLFSLLFNAQHYTSRWYGMDEGLPQNSVKDIIKDKYGFIWLSTDGGILRYDGKNFLLYNNLEVNSLSFKDFLNYGNGNIICYNSDIKDCILISNRNVKKLPKEKVVWTHLIINNKLCKRFYKINFTEKIYPDIDYYYIQTESERYFFNNSQIEYQNKNEPRKTIYKGFSLKNLKNSFEQNGTVYINDNHKRRTIILKNGIVSYDNQPSLFNDPETKIYWHQGTKQIFAINKGNIYSCKIINGKPTPKFIFHYENIENEFLNCMFYDENTNTMYLGNVVKGLNIVNLSNFYVSQKNIPFSGEVVYEAQPFTHNSVITKEGIEYYRDKIKKIYSLDIKYDRRFLLYDDSDNLLYVEFNKIHRRYKSGSYQKRDSVSFQNKIVEGIFKINKNYLVNMVDNKYDYHHLYIFYNDQFKTVKNIFRFKNNINFVEGYGNDIIYVGTDNGIYIISLKKNKIINHFAQNIPIKEIQRTKDGNFWATTFNKGLYFLTKDKAVALPYDKEGYIANAHHILEDHKGFFWISSNNGLFKVSKKQLLDHAHGKNTRVSYYRYTKENGFLNNEFNGSANPGGNILKNGDFVFPSMEGFVFFNPDEIKTHYPRPDQLFIERAKNGKNTIHFKDTLRLKSDFKAADIYLDFPYYQNLENINVETKLENSENNSWEQAKNNRKFILSNVSPGNYYLHVRFLTSENGTFAYKKIRIEIKPFFYETLWFKVLVVLIGIIIIIIIIQMRTNFLRSINKILKSNLDSRNQELKETSENLELTKTKLKNESEYQQKIMESISHDITTPVRFISLMSQKLSEADNSNAQKKYFDSIYKTSEQLFKFTLGLKEYNELYKEENTLDDETSSIFEIVEDKKLLFEEMASEHNTTIANLCTPEITIRTNKNILSVILHNLIDNAVKNTKNGEIFIKVTEENAHVEIGIFDTGKGMTPTQIEYYSQVSERVGTENFVFKNYGLGLHMVIQLSKKLEAKITFHENIPKGTIVKLHLKK